MTVRSYLVTAAIGPRMDAWAVTAAFANWIEGRECGDRETWLVTCFDEHRDAFLAAAKAAGVTVEEIEGAGDGEAYKLLVGEPGTGWTPPREPRPDIDDDPYDGDDDPRCTHCHGEIWVECDDPIQCCDPRCDGELHPDPACGGTGLAEHQVIW